MTGPVVALVPAKDRADLVADTVLALGALAVIDEVLVIDDGSSDDTAGAAAAAGARVLQLPRNLGKGGAVSAAVAARPGASVYLMVDADTADSAATVKALLPPVVEGQADMTIAVPPSAGRRGGFGWVKSLAGLGIRRACGLEARAPLSGQRAVSGPLMRRLLPLAGRFGLETGLTIDAVREGARVVEIEAAIEHLHTGRSVAGFRHRAGQGLDIARALWSRLTSTATRLALMGLAFILTVSALLWAGNRWEAPSRALGATPTKVLIFGEPYLDLSDVGQGRTPNFDRLMARGAVGALSVYTYSSHPTTAEGYATLGAGVRHHAASGPLGDLGRALEAAHLRPAVASSVGPALASADVVLIDPGQLERAAISGDQTARQSAVATTDAVLGDAVAAAGPGALVMVVSVTPAEPGAHVTPFVVVGPGVPHGYVHSPSTKRQGIATLTDLAPTVLDALHVRVPRAMIGQPLRYEAATAADLGRLRTVDRDSVLRDRIGNPITIPFVIFQVLVYLLVTFLFAWRGGAGAAGRWLRVIVLAIASLPLAGLAFRLVPGMSRIGPASVAILFLLDAVVVAVASRARRHALSPLLAIMTTTAVALVVDVVTGLHLLTSSYIGYPLSGAGRFYGFGNAAFAVLAACAILSVSIHLHGAARPREALVAGSLALAVVLLADVAPTMGDDAGGALTLVPVLGLMLWVLWGRRLSWRAVVGAAVVTVGAVAGLAAIDAARSPYRQTHVARFLTGVRAGGGGAFWPTLVRRVSNNVTALEASVWTAIVPLLVLGLIFLIVRSPRWGEVITAGPLRVGAVAAFGCGLLGFLANDSGVIVPALVFVFVGPYAVLLALDHEAGGPTWLEPTAASGRAAPVSATSS